MESYGTAVYSTLEALPAGWVGEVIDEELVASPRLRPYQLRAAFMLGATLGDSQERHRPGRWCFQRSPELRLGLDVLVPDLAGWRRERLTSEHGQPLLHRAPDWVCEVLAPTTAALDRTRKLPAYARAGVAWAWIVDPLAQTLEVFQRVKRGWLLAAAFESEALVRAEPFTSLSLELDSLWSEDSPSPER
jgi:Uma2 family endonuclease